MSVVSSAETVTPSTASEAAGFLLQAAHDRTRVTPVGCRSRLHLATDPSRLIALSCCGLTTGFAHHAGDLVATVPAGLSLSAANASLASQGQWIPLDPLAGSHTTIGGLVAMNDSGPRRHGYGSPRDLIIGIEVALANGTVAHGGGRVVKNVAGYDLGRLFCGSRGSLGLITAVTFKLAPLPRASRTVVAHYASAADAARAALVLARSALTPSCLEVVAPEPRLLVRFESTASSADRMAEHTRALLAGASRADIVRDENERAVWERHHATFEVAPRVDKLVALPMRVPDLLEELTRLADVTALSARPAVGVVDIVTNGPRPHPALARVTSTLEAHVDVVRGDPHDPLTVEPPRSTAGVMRAVKQQFDPAGILAWPWEPR
ncbi:MAG: FAD-binding oxidoreductase [Acidobacteria bacterium]|nr:FAD-binding oxidoreductase [Acidobacteriota bacterium]